MRWHRNLMHILTVSSVCYGATPHTQLKLKMVYVDGVAVRDTAASIASHRK